ncbi:hypothetical protein [Paracoccus sp. JM45]|uniref:hypothetical protein n=1 Tax=Paracoccus sp. JM45 TaxID=2283626 RepID=UPI000E6B5E83|nr:hypothetical protein [Paracoccus sp. JM45]RJE79481.1 hypothetical protein DWB67_11535 [Paracoccus sp. JM45]
MPYSAQNRPFDPVLLFAVVCLSTLTVVMAGLVMAHTPKDVFAESGPIERLSAIYLVCAAIWLGVITDLSRWHQVVLIAAGGLRELDWDKAFTDSGILSLRLYSGDSGWGQKLAGLVILVLLMTAGLRLLRRDFKPWVMSLRAGDVAAWLVAGCLGLHVIAKTLDGLGRKLAPWGINLSDWTNTVAGRAEEALELVAAILILQVVALISAHQNKG